MVEIELLIKCYIVFLSDFLINLGMYNLLKKKHDIKKFNGIGRRVKGKFYPDYNDYILQENTFIANDCLSSS